MPSLGRADARQAVENLKAPEPFDTSPGVAPAALVGELHGLRFDDGSVPTWVPQLETALSKRVPSTKGVVAVDETV